MIPLTYGSPSSELVVFPNIERIHFQIFQHFFSEFRNFRIFRIITSSYEKFPNIPKRKSIPSGLVYFKLLYFPGILQFAPYIISLICFSHIAAKYSTEYERHTGWGEVLCWVTWPFLLLPIAITVATRCMKAFRGAPADEERHVLPPQTEGAQS